ncbi:hypothetical protein EW146_g4270 [Bondarzewia mesenterica]|uniref:Nuclear speckle splicing regulatory protein 1 N-terminal domain-containing protein n=1 Tax=Bondarzewia mesenterica TaxID=1095465 RepID=A0A4S4LV04_9AGAM|nr:hypothetical protein EW146_g4270 [Bondarzewia mesenterica]
MKLSFSLASNKPRQKPVGTAPSLKRPAAFASLDDEAAEDTTPTTSNGSRGTANQRLIAQNVELSKAARKRMEAEQKIDSTVFEYDEVWENMQEAKLRQKEAKEQESLERKVSIAISLCTVSEMTRWHAQPKYISNLLSTAATRRLDHLRAEEKMIQREREAEGDEFKDKEAFVTQAYKDQMAEVKRAEEEEKEREGMCLPFNHILISESSPFARRSWILWAELERKKNGPSTGLAHFYRKMLEESEQMHEQTVAATMQSQQKAVQGPQGPIPNLTITKPTDFTPKSDLELARLAREQGKEVELNEDNQIVDKRELLSAGLNLSAPNTRRLGLRTSVKKVEVDKQVEVHRAVGTAASQKEINDRRRREIASQLESEQERVMKEKERREQEATARIIARRNDDADIQNAIERYRQRKRQKLEQATLQPSEQEAGIS